MLFAEGSALDHVLDTYVWHFVETFHWEVKLIPGVLSKYAILMMLAAGLVCLIYVPLAKKIQTGAAPTGLFWNLFESILTFIRDDIAKPYIGKNADSYVHFLWTTFLFVLFCNLFGMVPFLEFADRQLHGDARPGDVRVRVHSRRERSEVWLAGT